MEFTKENWETAPEGARLEWSEKLEWTENIVKWTDAHLIGFKKTGAPVIEVSGLVHVTHNDRLRIALPKRKVTVQLWRTEAGGFWAGVFETYRPTLSNWTFLAEHTFEVEGE